MTATGTIQRYLKKIHPSFGINKKQQITRLIYEISKRENKTFLDIIKCLPEETCDFSVLKRRLIKRRYPDAVLKNMPLKPYLPKLNINAKHRVALRAKAIAPKNIFYEQGASESPVLARLKSANPLAKFTRIKSIKDHIKKKRYSLLDYNKRSENFYITCEKFDFIKPCPCTQNAVSCGYHILNLGIGCVYECSYCYLQEYVNSPGIVIPVNIYDFFNSFRKYRQNIRIGTGEFTDSLALDDITEYSRMLIDFFRKHPGATLELKTKSRNIKNIVSTKPSPNIVISWSLNPQKIIDSNEFYTASLEERLDSARKCSEAGYRIGFHFDPIIIYEGWEKDYRRVIDELFSSVKNASFAWISLGTFRFSPGLKTVIESRFPQNKILDGELLLGFDNKMRYVKRKRINVYKNMVKWIKKHNKDVFIYLCMEDRDTWKALRSGIVSQG